MSMDVSEYSRTLAEQSESVCAMLLPGGRRSGNDWVCGDVAGGRGNSLKVCLSGSKAGIWADFAAGISGDLIDLWSASKGISLAEAIREVKEYLGVSTPSFVSGRKEYRRPARPANVRRPVSDSPVMQYLKVARGLSPESISAYQIAEASEVGPYEGWNKQEPWKADWIVFPYKRGSDLVSIKYLNLERRNGKKMTLVEPGCEPCLFGWQAIPDNSRTVAICEGELDALSLWQYGFPALSVPFGGGKGDKQQWIDHEWENLERFSDVYLCMDADAAGREAVSDIVRRLGAHRCRIVSLPCKDANECLITGVSVDVVKTCFGNAQTLDPEELVGAEKFGDDLVREFYPPEGVRPGFDMPWSRKGRSFRFSPSEVSVWTGINGHGKSLVLGQVMLHSASVGERVCIASFEMLPKKTLARMCRQSAAVALPSRSEINSFISWVSGRMWIYNHVGTANVDRLLEVFEYASRRYGVNQFVVDSLLKCGISTDDYAGQKGFVERLCSFALRTGSHVHLVAHSRKLESEMNEVGKMDVKGSGDITDLAFNVFSVWRNKKKEKQIEAYETGNSVRGVSEDEARNAPDASIVCSKCREDGSLEGSIPLWFHPSSLQYIQRPEDPPVVYSIEDMDETHDYSIPDDF